MQVSQEYLNRVRQSGYSADDMQRQVVAMLDIVQGNILNTGNYRSRLSQLLGRKPEPVKGLYLWGGTGRGKTFLMDTFYDVLPINEKYRLHFHRFMMLAHEHLHTLGKCPNALREVGMSYAKQYRVLCLDEMHIADEGDAAIIGGLLTYMLRQGMTLIITSNRAPNALTKDPNIKRLFRDAVDMLELYLDIVNMGSGIDYRLQCIGQAGIWHFSQDYQTGRLMNKAFQEAVTTELNTTPFVTVNQRNIPVVKWAIGVAWFNFEVICGPPRARIDYLEIAWLFHTVLISNVPLFNDENNDVARRFTLLIDELYEHNVKIIISAAEPITDLYRGTELAFEFRRTESRLREMQSHNYLARTRK